MALSRFQLSLLGTAGVAILALLGWLWLHPRQQADFVIETSIKPDTYIATRIDDTPTPEPVSLQAGIPDGYGVITHPDRLIYVGNFMNGQANGQGKVTYPGGASYAGEFSNGIPHGKGVCTYSSGKAEDCVFVLGERQ